jgi:hypothetical protein
MLTNINSSSTSWWTLPHFATQSTNRVRMFAVLFVGDWPFCANVYLKVHVYAVHTSHLVFVVVEHSRRLPLQLFFLRIVENSALWSHTVYWCLHMSCNWQHVLFHWCAITSVANFLHNGCVNSVAATDTTCGHAGMVCFQTEGRRKGNADVNSNRHW